MPINTAQLEQEILEHEQLAEDEIEELSQEARARGFAESSTTRAVVRAGHALVHALLAIRRELRMLRPGQ